jgi:hypothetical protein
LAIAGILWDSRCPHPNYRQGHSVPKQFFNQWSFQHYARRGDTNANAKRYTHYHSNPNSYRNGNTDCHSEFYANGNSNCYYDAEAYTDAKVSPDTTISSHAGT